VLTAGSCLLSEPSIEDSIATAFVHTLSQLRNTAPVISISTMPMPEPTMQRARRKQIERVPKRNGPAFPPFGCSSRLPKAHSGKLCSAAFRRPLRHGRHAALFRAEKKVSGFKEPS
jgi:hypothetical protein